MAHPASVARLCSHTISISARSWRLRTAGTLAGAALLCSTQAWSAPGDTDPAAALRARYAALSHALEQNAYRERLYIESVERADGLEGDVYAVLDYPAEAVAAALAGPANWCEALILHVNVKYCSPLAGDRERRLSVAIGRKYDQPVEDAFRVEFDYRRLASTADYLYVELDAARGPFGTSDYRIGLEAVGVARERTFVHLSYSYAYGLEARLAMHAYLATAGRGKVGFTMLSDAAHPVPSAVAGVRGAVERNTMRYYLAIQAHLGAAAAPPAERFERSLEHYFAATERYPRQLHELDHATYVALKRHEHERQQLSP